MPKRFLALLLAASLPLTAAPYASADAYDGHPKLVVLVVIDQFRADYLERYRSEFKGDGFRLFLDKGAYFPDCYYAYANTKTAPGHATLGTGAYSNGTGINSNEWWDLTRNKQRPVSSVEDDRYTIVGATAPAATPVSVQQEETNSASASGNAAANAPPPSAPSSANTGGTAQSAAAAPAAPPAAAPAPKPAPAAPSEPGASPRNLLASTLGDELRLATEGQSRVYGVSLKDRAAILPAGATANGAFWIDAKTGRFVTSSYYMTALPQWAEEFDNGPAIQQAASDANVANLTNFYSQVGVTNAGNQYEIAFAEALITGEQLGSHSTTDMLTLSLSPNDIEGHHYGPDSPQEHAMVLGLDGDLDSFFTWLDKNVPGGLANVVVALSADHGIAPMPAVSDALGLPGAYINTKKLVNALNQAINAKFSPGENDVYVLPDESLPYLSLNEPMFERAGINEQEAENAVKTAMAPAFTSLAPPPAPVTQPATPVAPAQPAPGTQTPAATATPSARTAAPPASATPQPAGAATAPTQAPAAPTQAPPSPPPPRAKPSPELFRAYTRTELAAGQLPPTPFGQMLANSYSPNGGWYVMVIPDAFQMEGSSGTTHFSPYSYDRHVPLGFYGAAFNPGTYRGRVQPVDLAATLASLLGINQPSASVGTILTEALKPAGEYPYPKAAVHARVVRRHHPLHPTHAPASPREKREQPRP